MFVGVLKLVIFPKVAFFFDRGERQKDRMLSRSLFIHDLIHLLRAEASYTQVFIGYTGVFSLHWLFFDKGRNFKG